MPRASIELWAIAGLTASGLVLRPWRLPEATWAVLGAVLLVSTGLVPLNRVPSAVAKGSDVYLFLVGMMLAAELAHREGVFTWLAAHAAAVARGSALRLFVLTYIVGILITVFLSNDATAVVLTPAVIAAANAARARPLPYAFVCAFIANAASFVLPISNPANLVIFRAGVPALTDWLGRFALPSALAIAATFVALLATQWTSLRDPIERPGAIPPLQPAGRVVGWGLVGMALVLVWASMLGRDLGWPTIAAGAMVLAASALAGTAPGPVIAGLSWSIVPLVAGLFVVVEALEVNGTSELLRHLAQRAQSLPFAALVPGFATALAANLANNLPVGLLAGSVANAAGGTRALSDAILIGVDLGPNLSVTGSLATILWLNALRREGLDVSGWQFLKLGAVVMFPALVLALLSVAR